MYAANDMTSSSTEVIELRTVSSLIAETLYRSLGPTINNQYKYSNYEKYFSKPKSFPCNVII